MPHVQSDNLMYQIGIKMKRREYFRLMSNVGIVIALFLSNCLIIPKALGKELVKFTVHGIVMDEETKEPLPGASVIIQDKSNGTVTDINGQFNIDVVSNDYRSMLEISYLGYEKKL